MEDLPSKTHNTAIQKGVEPLLAHVEGLYDQTRFKQFAGGFAITFKSIRFLAKRPKLWPNVAIPALINMVLFFLTAGLLVSRAPGIVGGIWAQPEGILLVVWYFLLVVVGVLLLAVAYLSMLLIGSLVASPFNDMLSQETERILKGEVTDDSESGFRGQADALLRSLVMSLLILAMQAVSSITLGLLGLIPGLGLITGPLAIGISAYLISVEYSDFPLERRRYSFKEKFKIVWKFNPVTVGFGAGTAILLWVPLLNFFTMPLAVIGGTAVGLSLDHRRHFLESVPAEQPDTT